jgi:hypothetical protein
MVTMIISERAGTGGIGDWKQVLSPCAFDNHYQYVHETIVQYIMTNAYWYIFDSPQLACSIRRAHYSSDRIWRRVITEVLGGDDGTRGEFARVKAFLGTDIFLDSGFGVGN